MAQLFPSVVCGVFTRWFNPWALLVGWAAGMASGSAMAVELGLKSSVYPLHFNGHTYAMYAAVPALVLNLVVSVVLTAVFRVVKVDNGSDVTDATAYVG
jgi:SSS family solute:Na+ symporter